MKFALKQCAKCASEYPLEEFYNDKRRKDGRSTYCKPCHSETNRQEYQRHREKRLARQKVWQAENREKVRLGRLRYIYGMAAEDYDRLLEKQGGVCAICGRPETEKGGRSLPVDHNHETGEVRGLLCGNCNKGIGNLKDDPDILRAAIRYLEGA